MLRGLLDSEIQSVHETSLKVLEQIGVDICHDGIREKLLADGAKAGSTSERVLFPRQMVMEALEKCDRNITLSSVRDQDYRLSSDSRFYSSCLVDPFMVDSDGVKRPPTLNDCVMNSRLVEGLDIIQMPYKMDVSYPDICSEDFVLMSNFAFMSNMSKHYVCAPHNVEEARLWIEMCEIMAGSPLGKKKIVSAYVSPISPLTLDKGFLELVEYLAPQGSMLGILPCPMAGATSPFSLAGTVVTFNSENLASIAVVQSLWGGTAQVYHNVAHTIDMRTAQASLGGPEKTLLAVAGADMGRFYDLPCGSAGSSTDSVGFDIQNGAQSMSQLLLTVSGKANLITGIGSLGSGNGTSAEQILFDCDLIGLAKYLQKGIHVDDSTLSFEALNRVGPGGDFLTDEQTLGLLRTDEHFNWSFAASNNPDNSMYENLRSRARDIINSYTRRVPEQKIAELEKYVSKRTKNCEPLKELMTKISQ